MRSFPQAVVGEAERVLGNWVAEHKPLPLEVIGAIMVIRDQARAEQHALDRLEHFVRTPEWSVSMLEDIASIVYDARPELADREPYDSNDARAWRSH